MKTYPISHTVEQELANRFNHHPPSREQVERYTQLRIRYLELARAVVELTPTSREQSLAITDLHKSLMSANAAIACNESPPAEEGGPAT